MHFGLEDPPVQYMKNAACIQDDLNHPNDKSQKSYRCKVPQALQKAASINGFLLTRHGTKKNSVSSHRRNVNIRSRKILQFMRCRVQAHIQYKYNNTI